MLCEGLVHRMRDTKGFRVLGSCSRGYSAWDLIKEKEPDIALLDLNLPGLTAIDIAERIVKKNFATKVIIFANPHHSDHNIRRALTAEVAGYIIKTTEPADLLVAIRRIADGEILIGTETTAQLADELQHNKAVKGKLSSREVNILMLLASGSTAAQIATDQALTTYTVRGYLNDIYRKLDVPNAPAAVAQAIRKGLIR